MAEKNKILVIEDDFKFANELVTCLKNGGFDTLHTDNVDDALKIIEEVRPTGISLDIQLKGSLGLNILKTLTSEKIYKDFTPVIIVVSSFIGPQTLPILQKYQIPYYDKTLPNFKYSFILDSFAIYLDNSTETSPTMNTINTSKSVPLELPTGDSLKKVIHQKLNIYKLNTRPIAYSRLVDSCYYMLMPDTLQNNSLTSIFVEILNVDYHTAFTGITRLLTDTFKRNPNIFYTFYHGMSEKELLQSKIKPVPTPSDFIYHIVTAIKKDY